MANSVTTQPKDKQVTSDFQQVKLKDIARVYRGVNTPIKKEPSESASATLAPDEYYIIRPRNVMEDNTLKVFPIYRIDNQNLGITPKDDFMKVATNYLLQPKDILLNTYTTKGKYLLTMVGNDLPGPTTYTRSLLCIRVVEPSKAKPEDVFAYLKTDEGQKALLSFEKGVKLTMLLASDVLTLEISLPQTAQARQNVAIQFSAVASALGQLKTKILPALELAEQHNIQVAQKSQELKDVADILRGLAVTLVPPSLSEQVLTTYPMPIALAYRQFKDARFNVYEQILRLRDLSESVIYFLYNIFLADACRRLDSTKYHVKDKDARQAHKNFAIHARLRFLDEILKIAGSADKGDLFLSELEVEVINLAMELKDFRNDLSHTSTVNEKKQRKVLEKYQPKVEEMLERLEFLSSYRLVQVPYSYYEKGKLVHRMELYQGVYLQVLEETLDKNSEATHADRNHLVLLNPEDQILDLYPFYQIIANEKTNDEKQICFFKRPKGGNVLEGESIFGIPEIELEGFDDYRQLTQKLTPGTTIQGQS